MKFFGGYAKKQLAFSQPVIIYRKGGEVKNAVYYWFIEPLDSKTNEVVAGELPGCNSEKQRRSDGREIDVWECHRGLINALQKSKRELGLNFRVYSRRNSGPLRLFPFPREKKKAGKAIARNAATGKPAAF